MKKERAEEIYKAYHEQDARVLITSMYVDTFARLWKAADVVMISSQVWDACPLTELEFDVNVYYPEYVYRAQAARIAKLEPALGEVIQMLEDCDAGNHGLLLTKAENKKLYEFKDLLKGG